MNLGGIESELRTLLADMSLRTTLERADRIGLLLDAARPDVTHGRWAAWLKALGLNRKTASDYVLAHRGLQDAKVRPVGQVGLRAFLEALRAGKRATAQAARAEARRQAAANAGSLPDGIELHHADCREFAWPSSVDIVIADPVWGDLDAAAWLAGFAADRLRPGGLLLAQASTHTLPAVAAILGARLSYLWTLAVVYHHANPEATGRFRSTWKPVLVYSRGPARVRASVCDTYTVHRSDRRYHRWQQPAEPWRYWLGRLAAPGDLVADPYAGAGTVPLVCRELGLRCVATESDREAYEVACGRLAGASPRQNA